MSKNKVNLFYTLKIETSEIIKQDRYIELSFQQAKEQNKIVSLGDNQIFTFIRRILNVDYERLMENIRTLNEKKESVKKLEKSKENSRKIGIIQNRLNELMFIPHIVSVKCDGTRSDYKNICKTGFQIKIEINGKVFDIKYKRLCAGAGQLRRNTSLFVNVELYEELEKIMMCGLDKKKIGKINLAKFSAYYALYSSSTNKVTTPRICVVNDFEHILKNEKISWIFDDENGNKDIEVREMDVEINAFDGSGMISPEFAEQWMLDLSLDYLPTSFIVRSAWIKGLVSVFDFKRFAKEIAKKEFMIDAWGNKQYVKDIDVILTKSQFKMYKKYKSWEEYCGYYNKFGHVFGVARVNKKYDNFYTPMNYQYVQSNDFTKESIKRMSDYTLEWIKKILSGDVMYTSLFLLGLQEEDKSITSIENELGTYISKTLMYNKEILNDEYVRMKINQTIQKKIDQLKIGKILIEGSYDFAIPDLYAMCESAFGMEVKGLLGRKQCWCKRWVDKGSERIAIMRSPLVAPAENQLSNVYSDEICTDWFSYIKSGIIINAWDTTMNRCSDADFDGDLLMSTDNPYLIQAVNDEAYPIMYEKNKMKEQNINPNSFASMDTKSFDSKIGFITNLASTFIAMKGNFKPESKEYKEIDKRINLLRYYQGCAIDATKGDVFTPPPSFWSKRQKYIKYDNSMTEEEILISKKQNEKISFNNRICADKKPYFFGYIYKSIMNQYSEYKRENEKICRILFSCKVKDLIFKEQKTEKEREFIYKYNRYIPIINNGCIVNTLSRYVEGTEFENKWKNNKVFDYNILKSNKEYNITKKNKESIKDLCKKYHSQYAWATVNCETHDNIDNNNSYFEIIRDNFVESALDVCSNEEDLCNFLLDLYYNDFKNKSKSLLWNCVGNRILLNIKEKTSSISLPVEDENGVEYLGKKYSMREIEI